MPDKARLQVKTGADPEIYSDVGAGSSGVPVPVVVEASVPLTDGSQKTQIVSSTGVSVGVNEYGEMQIVSGGHIDTSNSSTTPLTGNATFTGIAMDVLDVATVIVNVKSSHASATDGLKIQFSPDGTNWDNQDVYTILAATGKTFSSQPSGRYMRVTYTNGATQQTYFRLETILKHTYTKPSSHRVQDTIVDDDDGELNLSVLKLRTAANNYVSGTATSSGNFKVSLEEYNGNVRTHGLPISFMPSNMSAFGSIETTELDPVLHLDFVYGVNTQTGVTTTVNSATVDTDTGRLRVQSGTNSAGIGIYQSRKAAKYRAGLGINARFTPIFSTGVANSIQAIGMFTVASNAIYDGYGFGYNGTSFGILHATAGSLVWVAETDWNGESATWDKTKGTPVMIKYPYLGYGDISFYVQNYLTGEWLQVHTIRYANTTNAVQLRNPSLNFVAIASNSGNTTNLTMYCGSVGVFVSGKRSFIGNPKWSMDSSKTGITTETNILTIKNAASFNGIVNRALLRMSNISVASSAASGIAIFRFKTGVTLGGSPSFTPVNGSTSDNGAAITSGNSSTSYDTAGTTVTGGTYLGSVVVDNPNTQVIDVTPYELFLAPNETLTVSAYSSISSVIAVSVNWSEDI